MTKHLVFIEIIILKRGDLILNNDSGKKIDTGNVTSPWIESNEIDWNYITHNIEPKKYSKNEVLFEQNSSTDYVYLINNGRVRLDIISYAGEEKTIFIAGKGIFIGDLSPIDNLPNICRATTSTDCEIYLILKSDFKKHLLTNIKFATDILYINSKKIRLLVEDIKQLSFNNAYYRVCYALVHLAKQYSSLTKEGYKLDMKFTHQEMANLTGLSRVSVSNIISELQSKEVLKKMDGYLLIKDINSILTHLDDIY